MGNKIIHQDLYVRESSREGVRSFIEKHHYSKNINGVKTSLCVGLYKNFYLVGACLFGRISTTAWKRFADQECKVIELRRLVLVDEMPHNTESWFVSRSIKLVKEKLSEVEVIVSYADPNFGHVGFIYQALNFIYIGKTNKDKILITPEGKYYHSRAMRASYKGTLKPFAKKLQVMYQQELLKKKKIYGKFCYVLPLSKKSKKIALNNGKPYPKTVSE